MSSTSRSLLLALLILAAAGCAQTQNAKVDSRYELRITVENFHRDLRWEEFERATSVIHPAFRNVFLGRYQEHGDDLDIVNLEIKTIANRATDHKIIEVEQKWFVKPDMTIKEKRFVEDWRRLEAGWVLRRRMRKTEWERRRREDRRKAPDDRPEAAESAKSARR